MQAPLDDNNTNRGDAHSSKLSVVSLALLWLAAVPLAVMVMGKALEAP